jgi:hypothetical protein
MNWNSLLIGALLIAAPCCAQSIDPRTTASYLLKFSLQENQAEVRARLGQPAQVADFGPNYFSWLYQIGIADHHDYSHTLCFSREDGKLLSVTRTLEEEIVDDLFPAAETSVHHWPSAEKPQYGLRLRRLSGDRLLLAMGSTRPGQTTSQLILIRRSALPFFFPWLASQLEKRPGA